MVHLCFRLARNNPSIVDIYASKNPHEFPKFTQIYKIFFISEGSGSGVQNLASWLNVISKYFVFPGLKANVHRAIISKVKKLFASFGLNPFVDENHNVYQFWVYLFWMYRKLMDDQDQYPGRNDNIFEFMKGFPIQETKVVIVANKPTAVPSSGFAFHDSKCPSTEQLIAFLKAETKLLASTYNSINHPPWMSVPYVEINRGKQTCSLDGWIKQRVLLLNSALTDYSTDGIYHGWKIFTDFIVNYLSSTLHNLVFILAGKFAGDKENLIDDTKHLIINVFHPGFYCYPNNVNKIPLEMDWFHVLPFVNANLYLYQTRNASAIIDWNSITQVGVGRRENVKETVRLFQRLSEMCCIYDDDDTVGDLQVYRNSSDLLYLHKADCEEKCSYFV